MIVMQI